MWRNRTIANGPADERVRDRSLLGDAVGSPSLDLNFAGGTLDPRIDFQRTTVGTYYRGQFNQNLALYSSDPINGFVRANVTAGTAITAPDGTASGFPITVTTTGVATTFRTGTITVGANSVTASCFIKKNVNDTIAFNLFDTVASATTATATFTFSTLAVSVSGCTATATDVGNGWYRIAISATWVAANGLRFLIGYSGGSGFTAGDSFYVWGVQVSGTAQATPHIPTTGTAITQGQIASSQPWNLLLRSQEFDNTTSWANLIGGTGVNPVRTANNAVAPDGTTTADTLTFNTGVGTTSADQSLIQQSSVAVVSGRQYTTSVWMRGTVGGEQIQIRDMNAGTYTVFTCTTSWQRFSITSTNAGNQNLQIGIRQGIPGTVNSTATVELWGAQINEGSSALDYRSTTSSALWLPRFENDPVTGEARGLLIEGGATNLCLQSADLATTWNVGTRVTVSTNVITAPDGTVSADAVHDAATTNSHELYQSIGSQSTTATYTVSAFIKKGNRRYVSIGNIASGTVFYAAQVDLDNPTAAPVTGANGAGFSVSGATVTNVGNDWYRVTVSGIGGLTTHYPTFVSSASAWAGGTANPYPNYAGSTANFTYVWGFQYEQQAFASSYIPTTTGSLARGADSAVMTGTNFSSWYNQSEGTLLSFSSGIPAGLTGGRVVQIDNGTNNERVAIATGAAFVVVDGGSVQANINIALASTAAMRGAGAYKVDDFSFAVNGGSAVTDTLGTLPTPDRLVVGATGGGASYLNAPISRIAYWPTRLPNATLQSLTT